MRKMVLAVGAAALLAAKSRDELIKEAVESAQFYEKLGYVLAGLGILFVVASIPVGIYLDRKKKARRKAARAESGQDG